MQELINTATSSGLVEQCLDKNGIELTPDEVDFLYAVLEKDSNYFINLSKESKSDSDFNAKVNRIMMSLICKICAGLFGNDVEIIFACENNEEMSKNDYAGKSNLAGTGVGVVEV